MHAVCSYNKPKRPAVVWLLSVHSLAAETLSPRLRKKEQRNELRLCTSGNEITYNFHNQSPHYR